jgi:5-methylcytosine-specific restriction endonuclease McrA
MNPWERNDCNRHIIIPEDYNVMYCATKYHDIGKVFCKTFTNSKGEMTDIAHYYNHANVGAYIYLTTVDSSDIEGFKNELLIANLIADHMKFFNGEKAIEKLREKYGDKFWMLEELHEFDTSAH